MSSGFTISIFLSLASYCQGEQLMKQIAWTCVIFFFCRLAQEDKSSKKNNTSTLEAMMKIFSRRKKRVCFHVPEVRLELYYTEDAKDFRYAKETLRTKSKQLDQFQM